MRKNNKIVSIIALILALIMVVGIIASLFMYATGVSAVTVTEMESQRDEAQKQLDDLKSKKSQITAQQDELKEKISKLETESAGYEDQKRALDEKVELTLQEIDNIKSQIATYDTLIEEKEMELQDARDNQADQLERYKARIRAMEENGNMSYYEILFSAKNFSELLNKISDMQEIMEYDNMVADQLQEAAEAVENAKVRLEETQAELEITKAELDEMRVQLEADVDAAQAKIDQLKANIGQSEDEIKALEEDAARLEEDITSKTQSVKELDSSIQAAIAASKAAGTPTYTPPAGSPPSGAKIGSGMFIWPTSSYTVTSNYGYRIHPITGSHRLHAGVDIGAPTGTPIYAAADGVVVTSVYSNSYGNYILINHGGGIYTLYAHASALYVSAGAVVIQGQTIAAVGSTGNSTGPHLHFEVRVNGSTVNPLNYF